jgi:hypothetical protein
MAWVRAGLASGEGGSSGVMKKAETLKAEMQRISRSEQPAASAVKKMTCAKRFFRKGLTNIWNPRQIRLFVSQPM